MEADARTLPDGQMLEAQVCIVGAGPAGLTLARAIGARGIQVAVLESGGRAPDRDVQALAAGATRGDRYAGPGATRRRQAGGTANDWNTEVGGAMGAKYVPLDGPDLEERDWLPWSGWPFDRTHLDPYYARAHRVCGIGPYTYRGEDWEDAAHPVLPLAGELLATRVYQLGSARPFTETYLEEIRRADTVALYLRASVVELATDPAGETVTEARVRCLGGARLSLRASVFVLATGGIENARLLLLSGAARGPALGNRAGLVGRGFMEHPRDVSCVLVPRDSRLLDRADFYDAWQAPGGLVMGRLALTDQALRAERLLNASVTLRPRVPGYRPPGRFRRLLARWGVPPPARGDIPTATGWSRLPDKSRRFETFELTLNLEQAPDLANRVTLGRRRDALGQPRVQVEWRWRASDQRNLDRVRHVLGQELERAGVGRLLAARRTAPDPNAHHHLGTTRMHRDPTRGVVDAFGRVHGTSNLFVAGSSTFPTGGFANPTLTIVALALRLADHLNGLLGRPEPPPGPA